MPTQNEPFVPQEDRPEVKIDLDQPVAQLKVRDLQAILGSAALKKIEIKELKHEKFEIKEHKFEKHEIKELKHEKFEIKEHKFEKHEIYEVPNKLVFETGPDPTQLGDPLIRATLNDLVQTVGNLAKRVDDLANQVKAKK